MALLKKLWMIIPLLLSSCAVTRGYVAIDYTAPPHKTEILEHASDIQVHVHVVDNRQKKEVVGHKKNGYGMRMAPILTTNSVEVLVSKAIKTELANRGFVLVEGEGFLVDVEVKKFYNKFKPGLFTVDGVAEVVLIAKVLTPERKELFSEEILGREVEWPVFIMGGNNAKVALERALVTAVSKIITNESFLAALLNNQQIVPADSTQSSTGFNH